MKNAKEMHEITKANLEPLMMKLQRQIDFASSEGNFYIRLHPAEVETAKEFVALGYNLIPATDVTMARLSWELPS